MFSDVIAGAIGYFLQTLLLSLVTIFISIPLALIILVGYLQMRKRKIRFSKQFLIFLCAALIFPTGEALLGAACYDTHSEVATNASSLLFGLSFLLTVAATVKESGRRLLVFGIGCAFVHWTFWAWLMTQMSIANSWL